MQPKQARQDLADCYRYLCRLGLLGTFGHVSLRVPNDTSRLFITPISSSMVGDARAEDILLIDLDGHKLEGETPESRPRQMAFLASQVVREDRSHGRCNSPRGDDE